MTRSSRFAITSNGRTPRSAGWKTRYFRIQMHRIRDIVDRDLPALGQTVERLLAETT